MNVEEFRSADFRHFQNWQYWRTTAFRLRDSAHALFKFYAPNMMKEEMSYNEACNVLTGKKKAVFRAYPHDSSSVVLLYGASLENIFKAVVVFQNQNSLNLKRLPKSVLSHDLEKLAKTAGMSVSQNEIELLNWVAELVVWRGRYPVPVTSHSMSIGHSLDTRLYSRFRKTMRDLDSVFKRADKNLPPRARRRRNHTLVAF